jgi:hypothetical protein
MKEEEKNNEQVLVSFHWFIFLPSLTNVLGWRPCHLWVENGMD